MGKLLKIALGLATLWPLAYIGIFLWWAFSIMFATPIHTGSETDFGFIFPLHLLTMLCTMVLTVIYMVNVFKNDRVVGDRKVLWAVVIFMGGIIAMPIYWYLYIWREPPTSGATRSTSTAS